MAQGVLPYKYEEERTDAGMTALAGLPIYLDLASVLGIAESIRAHVHMPLPEVRRIRSIGIWPSVNP